MVCRPVPTICKFCQKTFNSTKTELERGKGKYCSASCAGKKSPLALSPKDGKNNGNWKGGVSENGRIDRYRKKYPEKYIAHRLLNNAVRSGKLKRMPCVVCGKEKVEGHHEDYSKPLDVIWLCKKHHLEAHKKPCPTG